MTETKKTKTKTKNKLYTKEEKERIYVIHNK